MSSRSANASRRSFSRTNFSFLEINEALEAIVDWRSWMMDELRAGLKWCVGGGRPGGAGGMRGKSRGIGVSLAADAPAVRPYRCGWRGVGAGFVEDDDAFGGLEEGFGEEEGDEC